MLGLITILVIVAVAFLGVGLWLWWWFPRWQMCSLTAADPKARADIEDNFRKTVGQALGGILVLLAAGLAYYGTFQTLQANHKAAHDLLISNQVSKGFDLLGNKDSLLQRLGGIYALEGVMNASEQYHQPVLEALSEFVRTHAPRTMTGDGPPTTDIQAALTVIGRRTAIGNGRPDLSGAHIPKADLSGANLSGVRLSDADLTGAKITQAQLDLACGTNVKLDPGLTIKPC